MKRVNEDLCKLRTSLAGIFVRVQSQREALVCLPNVFLRRSLVQPKRVIQRDHLCEETTTDNAARDGW